MNCKAQTIVNINTYPELDDSNKYYKDINNHFPNFVGTWENTTGNITFRLILWKVPQDSNLPSENSFIDRIYGKYLILQNAGLSTELILYNSVKFYPQSGATSNFVLMGRTSDGISCGGYFEDTNANSGTSVLNADYSLIIQNLGSTPLQARWRIKPVRVMTATDSFTVPTDCIMTKI